MIVAEKLLRGGFTCFKTYIDGCCEGDTPFKDGDNPFREGDNPC
jgi:hypothetical protein